MERLYGLTGKTPAKPFVGQAALVFAAMGGSTGVAPEFKTAKAWTEDVVKAGTDNPVLELKTRQDPYRVVLYYILIFKKRELVVSRDPVIETPVETTITESAYTKEQLENPETEEQLQAALEALDSENETVAEV